MNIPSADIKYDSKVKCLKSYLICASPRTGSTMLSHILMDTKMMGKPFEYLHDHAVEAFLSRVDRPSGLGEYVNFLKSRRCSKNGVFGFKAQYEQVNRRFPNETAQADFIANFEHFILIYRRDVLSQAISFHRAVSTGVWHEMNNAKYSIDSNISDKFDADKIAAYMVGIAAETTSWRRLLSSVGVPWIEVSYEELVEEPTKTVHRVMKHVDFDLGALPRVSKSKLRRQSDGINRTWKERFISEHHDLDLDDSIPTGLQVCRTTDL